MDQLSSRDCPGKSGDRSTSQMSPYGPCRALHGMAGLLGVVGRLETVAATGYVDHLDIGVTLLGGGQELLDRRRDLGALQFHPGQHDRQPFRAS